MTEAVAIGPSVDAIIESVTFSDPDPRIQKLRTQWIATRRELQAVLEKSVREHYEDRLQHHRTCQELAPALLAENETRLFRHGLEEERNETLGQIWFDIGRQIQEIMLEADTELE